MRRATVSFFLLLVLMLSFSCPAAGAAADKEARDSANPSAELQMSEIHGNRRFTLYASENGMYQIQIDRRERDAWITEAVNAAIQPWNQIPPSLAVKAEDLCYLRYIDTAYAALVCDASGAWRLTSWVVSPHGGQEVFFSLYPNAIGIYAPQSNAAQAQQWIYGSLQISPDLNALDTGSLPLTLDDVSHLIDPEGWAVISSADGTGWQRMYQRPDAAEDALCTLYDGAPVRVLHTQGDWTSIEVAGMTGWVPQASLIAGMDMLTVPARFPDLTILHEVLSDETLVYASPSTDAPVLYSLECLDASDLDAFWIIGFVSDEWYAVFNPKGISGFMEAKWFYPGNG